MAKDTTGHESAGRKRDERMWAGARTDGKSGRDLVRSRIKGLYNRYRSRRGSRSLPEGYMAGPGGGIYRSAMPDRSPGTLRALKPTASLGARIPDRSKGAKRLAKELKR